MKAVVCVRIGDDGLPGPFDACAYEEALRLPDASVTILSMGGEAAAERLRELTRLGAKEAVLLSDASFAGSDTLATARVLARAIERLKPDLVLCGRKTLIGDTGQTPLMLASLLSFPVLCDVMRFRADEHGVIAQTRTADEVRAPYPCLLTLERISDLRLPRLFSPYGTLKRLHADDLGFSSEECGLAGSPTRVVQTREKEGGERKCVFLPKEKFAITLEEARSRHIAREESACASEPLAVVAAVGDAALAMARTVCEKPLLWPPDEAVICKNMKITDPDAILFPNTAQGRTLAARLATRYSLGLCADCTRLGTADGRLLMIRPARSGRVEATVVSVTRPALATVLCASRHGADVILSCGYGAGGETAQMDQLARKLGASPGASRKAVDAGLAPYERQVGLSGKSVFPAVYIAVGISGQVHHIVGMEHAACVIAVNPDKDAPIFRYADFGFVMTAQELIELYDAR